VALVVSNNDYGEIFIFDLSMRAPEAPSFVPQALNNQKF
jgi:hypothetical protein